MLIRSVVPIYLPAQIRDDAIGSVALAKDQYRVRRLAQWTPAEVDTYRKHHKIGAKARVALELMMNVGARISDAARIGRQHESEGWLKFVALKNRNKKFRKTIECIREARNG
jgi:hypothetical protein